MTSEPSTHLPTPTTHLYDLQPPIALGPLDGRYRGVTQTLVDYLSEAALNRARIHVEVEWLIFLTANRVLPGASTPTTSPNSRPPRT